MSRVRKEATRLASGSLAQTAANALVAVLSTRWLSPNERGVMVVAATIPALVSVLATLGVGNSYRSRRPAADAAAVARLGRGYADAVVATAALGGVASLALGWVAAQVTFPELASPAILGSLLLAGVTLCTVSTLTDAWFAGARFGVGARWAAGSAVAGLVATVALRPDTAASFLLIQFAAMGLVMLVSLRPLRVAGLVGLPGDVETMAMLVREGAPSLGFAAGTAVTLRSDRLILAAFASPAVVATYALASTISEVVRIVPTSLGQLALHRGAQDAAASIRDLRTKGSIAVVALGVVGLPIAVAAIPFFFGPAYATAWKMLALMLVGEVFFCGYLVVGMNLVGRGDAPRVSAIALSGALLCVSLYTAGSAVAGGVGCAIAGVLLYASLNALVHRARVRALKTRPSEDS